MSTRPRLRLAPYWWAGGAILIAYVIYECLVPARDVPLVTSDKLLHFGAYFGLGFWFAGMTDRRHYPLVAIGLLLMGALIELAQGSMGLGRSADWRDFLANALGVCSALGIAYAGLGSWMMYVERRLGVS